MWSFGENISELDLTAKKEWRNKSRLKGIPNKVTVDFDIIDAFVKDRIGGDMKRNLIITI